MADWKVAVVAPNGAKADFVVDAAAGRDLAVKQFTKLLEMMVDHDPDPLAGIEHTAPLEQDRKQAVGRK